MQPSKTMWGLHG